MQALLSEYSHSNNSLTHLLYPIFFDEIARKSILNIPNLHTMFFLKCQLTLKVLEHMKRTLPTLLLLLD